MAQRGNVSYPMSNATSAQLTQPFATYQSSQTEPRRGIHSLHPRFNDVASSAPFTTVTVRPRQCSECLAESEQVPQHCPGRTALAPHVIMRMEGPCTFSDHAKAPTGAATYFYKTFIGMYAVRIAHLQKDLFKAIFNVEQMTRQVRKEVITFVWNAIIAARRAIRRRDSV